MAIKVINNQVNRFITEVINNGSPEPIRVDTTPDIIARTTNSTTQTKVINNKIIAEKTENLEVDPVFNQWLSSHEYHEAHSDDQVADGITITGAGLPNDPFVAVQQVADGVTITGTGDEDDPFVSKGGITDAPSDDKLYGRKNGVWEEIAEQNNGVNDETNTDIVVLTTESPSYTITDATKDNLFVRCRVVGGEIILGTPTEDKTVILTNYESSILLRGVSYSYHTVIYLTYDTISGGWSIVVIPYHNIDDQKDIAVQHLSMDATSQGSIYLTFNDIATCEVGDLVFIYFINNSAIGVYKILNAATKLAYQLVVGIKLNIVRVEGGFVYYNQYDGADIATLLFTIFHSPQVGDGITITGSGTPLDPFVAVGGGIAEEEDPEFNAWLDTNPLNGFELSSNKQNSLVTDGTGVKYPTVDAVNAAIGDIETLLSQL